jgi:hypothetical protein
VLPSNSSSSSTLSTSRSETDVSLLVLARWIVADRNLAVLFREGRTKALGIVTKLLGKEM